MCTVEGVQVSNQKWKDRSGAEGLRPRKRSRVEVEDSDEESEWSGFHSTQILYQIRVLHAKHYIS